MNRLVNLAGDDRSAGFIAVHVAIAVVSLALAVPVGVIGWRLRDPRRGRGAPPAG